MEPSPFTKTDFFWSAVKILEAWFYQDSYKRLPSIRLMIEYPPFHGLSFSACSVVAIFLEHQELSRIQRLARNIALKRKSGNYLQLAFLPRLLPLSIVYTLSVTRNDRFEFSKTRVYIITQKLGVRIGKLRNSLAVFEENTVWGLDDKPQFVTHAQNLFFGNKKHKFVLW